MAHDPLAFLREPDGTLPEYGDEGAIAYLDGDGSTICFTCARKADADPGEVPQFKPVAYFQVERSYEDDEEPPELCDGCSEPLDPRPS